MSPEILYKNMSMDFLPSELLASLLDTNTTFNMSSMVNLDWSDPKTTAVISRHRIWPCFFWITFVIGMFGNWLVVYILFRKKNLRTVTNLYLLNLAVVDILYLMTTIPNTSFWKNYWPWGQFMCKLIHYMMGVTLTVSVLSLTAVGLDRHYAILYPISSRQHRTLRKTSILISFFWIFAFVVSSPAFVIARKIDIFDMEVCLSYWRQPWEHRTYAVSMFVFFYLIPQAILAVCYFRIAKRLWFTMRLHDKPNGKSLQTLKTRRRVVKMVIVVTACFAVCWLPVHLVELYTAYGTNKTTLFYDIKVLAPLVPHFFIATNPIIYCFMSKTFRMNFKAVFPCINAQAAGVSMDDHDSAINRKSTDNFKSLPMKTVSECSLEASNIELNDKIESVDKAVNTSPKLEKKPDNEDTNSTSDGLRTSQV